MSDIPDKAAIWVVTIAGRENWDEPCVRLFHSKEAAFIAIRQTLLSAEENVNDDAELERAMLDWDAFLADLSEPYSINPKWDSPHCILLRSVSVET
jgi:hypothetical protein